ncbi:MAG: metallopeptidase (SprT family) [Porticoccus sp.]|jgi:SprT protein|nr:metallopeptidase (SprT family) [Porticoccus sp.]
MPDLSRTSSLTIKSSNMITPIGSNKQQDVINHTNHYIEIGSQLFNIKFDLIPILFDLSGRCAGMYKWKTSPVDEKENLGVIRYNPWIFAKYYEENFIKTVPHEAAHYLARMIYGDKLRPHGLEWKVIMRYFGADTAVSADFDMNGIPIRKSRKYKYYCNCMTYQLGIRRHNRYLNNETNYYCNICRSKLNFLMEY